MGNSALWYCLVEPLLARRSRAGGHVGHRSVRARAGNLLVVFLLFTAPCLAAAAGDADARVRSLFESPAASQPRGQIDELVFARLAQLGIEPAHPCSDAVFVRRVYLDAIGTLPSAAEAQQFMEDRTAEKRRILIDHLLERDEFTDYWAMKWSDLLRVKAEFPVNLWPNAAEAYHHWIRTSIKENLPYDQFARTLLTSSGSNFRVPPANFYRAIQRKEPAGIAQAVALTFMGTRAEKWPAAQLSGMAAFFSKVGYKPTSEWKEEIVYFDPGKAPAGGGAAVTAGFPDGTAVQIPSDRDPREVFADWLINPKNPWFTRNVANRIWCWLLGRGIIHEPDDIRPDNPPANPELLTLMATELVAAHYDLKHIYRLILNSATYQFSCIPRTEKPEGVANFASYPLRRLDAEVLIDALNEITGSTENYSSAIPEPYTFMPAGQRAIALPDGSITSTFLETFGRPPRDTGLESERTDQSTAMQRLQLLNSSQIQQKLAQGPKLRALFLSAGGPREIVDALYMAILSRHPTPEERDAIRVYMQSGSVRGREAVLDVAWALINSAEFLYRH